MAASLAHSAVRLRELGDGTRLSVGVADGKITLSADGMAPITLTLPVSDLMVNDDLREQLRDITMLTWQRPEPRLVLARRVAVRRRGVRHIAVVPQARGASLR